MAPSVPGNKAGQRARKGLVQPVLPALPIVTKSKKQKQAANRLRIPSPTADDPDSNRKPEDSSTPGNAELDPQTNGFAYTQDETVTTDHALTSQPITADDSDHALADQTPPAKASRTSSPQPTDVLISELPEETVGEPQPEVESSVGHTPVVEAPADVSQESPASEADNTNVQDESHDKIPDPVPQTHPSVGAASEAPPSSAFANGLSPSQELLEQTPRPSSSQLADTDQEVSSTEQTFEVDDGADPLATSMVNGHGDHSTVPNDESSSAHNPSQYASLPTLADHVLQLNYTKEMADWVIQVTSGISQPFLTYAHSVFLSRSPRLRKLMQQLNGPTYSANNLNLSPPRFVVPHAFEAALRFLYSDAVLSTDGLFPRHTPGEMRAARTDVLEYLVSYWISGVELGLEPVTSRAQRLLGEFVDWDVAEAVMKEGSALYQFAHSTSIKSSLEAEYAVAGLSMHRTVLRFLSTRLDAAHFQLDVNSSSTVLVSRLHQLEETRSRPNPALASMVFGSMPSSATMSPTSPMSEVATPSSSFPDTTASNILLNLDFDDLKAFSLDILAAQGEGSAKVLAAVVEERENRRLRILSNRAIPNKQRMANSTIWDVVAFKETFENGDLRRERVGFLLPTKH